MKKRDRTAIRVATRKVRNGLLLLAPILALPWSASGQLQPAVVWASTNGSSAASAKVMTLDPAGNILVAGLDDGDYRTAKYDPAGNLLWSDRYAGKAGWSSGISAIAADGAGNVYVTGGLGGSRSYTVTFCDWFGGCHNYRIYLNDQVTVKYNTNGQRQWVATYFEKGDSTFVGNAIAVDPGGNVYVGGTVTAKYDAAGQQVWLKTNVTGMALALDKSGNICLTGPRGTQKLDPNGNPIWNSPTNGTLLKLDEADNILVTAGSTTTTTKFDSDGRRLWSSPHGGTVLVLDAVGNAYLGGSGIATPNGLSGYATVKLDRRGNRVWQALTPLTELRLGMAVDRVGNVHVSCANNGSYFNLKYDADGVRVWQKWDNALPAALALDAAGNLYFAGTSSGFVIIKYSEVPAPGAPVITTPPSHPLARPGDNVTLSVNAVGEAPLSFDWSSLGTSFRDTNATLTLTNAQPAQAGMYYVEVANALGTASSPLIYLSLLGPLPDQIVVRGAPAFFTVPLSFGTSAAFQWQFNGVDLPGENNSTLLVTNAGLAQQGDYTVVVSNFYGNVLTSTVARLTIDSRVTQAWAASVPDSNVGDIGQALDVDAAGNVFVTGYSGCGHKTVKFGAAGQKVWETCDDNHSTLGGLVVDPSGNVCIAGTGFGTNTVLDIATIKYSPDGSALWSARFDASVTNNDIANAIAADGVGNFYVAGRSIGGTNGYDIITVKYDPSGNQLWAARYDGASHGDDFPEAIVADGGGNVYVCGASLGPADYDFTVLKYGANGDLLWARTYDGPADSIDVASHLVVDRAGFVYVTGWSRGENYVTDFATIKYDAAGTPLWVARYAGPGGGEDNPHGLAVDAAGNVYVTGSSVGTPWPRQYDIATVKYGPDGRELWVQRYNGPANGNDYSRALGVDSAGNVYVEGHSDSGPNGTTEVVTISYDTAGNTRWVARHETGVESGAYYRNGSLQIDRAGTVYVADTTFIGGSPSYLTLKYVQPSIVPTWLTAPALSSNGQFRCVLTGETNAGYTIQVSSDLRSWSLVTNLVTTPGGTSVFTDATPAGASHRYYRAVRP